MMMQKDFDEETEQQSDRIHASIWLGALLILALFLMVAAGCGVQRAPAATAAATKVTTPELLRDLTQDNKDLGTHLDAMKAAITAIPDTDPVKPVLLADFMPLPIDWSKINVTLGYTTKSVAQDVTHTQSVENEVVKLKANDPAKTALTWWGVAGILIGGLMVAAYFLSASIPLLGPIIAKGGALVRDIGFVVIGLGMLLVTLARFLTTLEDIIFWLCIAAGVGVAVLIVMKLAKLHWSLSALLDAQAQAPPSPLADATAVKK